MATSSSIKTKTLRFTLLAFLLSPVGYKIFDMYYGKYKFDEMCRANAGLNIYANNLSPTKKIRLVEGYASDSAVSILNHYPSLNEVEAPDEVNWMFGAFSIYRRGSGGAIESVLIGEVLMNDKRKSYHPASSIADYQLAIKSTCIPEKRIMKWKTDLLSHNGKLLAAVVGYHYNWTGWFFLS